MGGGWREQKKREYFGETLDIIGKTNYIYHS